MQTDPPLEIQHLFNGNPFTGSIQVRIGTFNYVDSIDLRRADKRHSFLKAVETKLKAIGADPAKIDELRKKLEAELDGLATQAFQRAAERPASNKCHDSVDQGRPVDLKWPEPWPEQVHLAEVLDEADAAIRRHVWIGEHQAAAAALWVSLAYHVDKCDVVPILLVRSPTKRCGKTTLGRVLAAMLPRVLAASNVTAAALFRTIEQYKPTLLIDEADTFLTVSDEVRGLVNAGHSRDTAFVIRTVGDNHEPRQFSVFGAKLLLGIGRLAPTIEDRSIIVTLDRKPPGSVVTRITRQAMADLRQIARKFMRWSVDYADQIDPDADPAVPEVLNDRQMDCWRPLIHLAELAGGHWPSKARAAAVALSMGADADSEELPIRLLIDLRTVFDQNGRDAIPTSELIDGLCRLEESPWPTLCKGRPITPHKLGRLLGGFGIRSRHGRRGNTYHREDLAPVWERYCPPIKRPSDNDHSQTGNQSFTPSPNDVSCFQIRI
jgi:hypothetical protein